MSPSARTTGSSIRTSIAEGCRPLRLPREGRSGGSESPGCRTAVDVAAVERWRSRPPSEAPEGVLPPHTVTVGRGSAGLRSSHLAVSRPPLLLYAISGTASRCPDRCSGAHRRRATGEEPWHRRATGRPRSPRRPTSEARDRLLRTKGLAPALGPLGLSLLPSAPGIPRAGIDPDPEALPPGRY